MLRGLSLASNKIMVINNGCSYATNIIVLENEDILRTRICRGGAVLPQLSVRRKANGRI